MLVLRQHVGLFQEGVERRPEDIRSSFPDKVRDIVRKPDDAQAALEAGAFPVGRMHEPDIGSKLRPAATGRLGMVVRCHDTGLRVV
ncbi:hypothetical protein [Rhizobium sp. BK602]|uniref:hypothetical protein n=1 Tax=Rhizobium sp. BK602 TaxID=2586986 RepID=UPI001613F06F|nr:hypothetical protein [Rhizobium sp. BK602]MBB3610885.1 hypothetical protein [Rhizobium sp. BK602]